MRQKLLLAWSRRVDVLLVSTQILAISSGRHSCPCSLFLDKLLFTHLGKTQQDYDLENPEGDRLLDALSLLEIHGDEACEGLAEARTGMSRLFPYFFTKKEEPPTFTALAKCFHSQEDLGLKLRQEGLKVGVEGTIALVADSQQNVDWARVATRRRWKRRGGSR